MVSDQKIMSDVLPEHAFTFSRKGKIHNLFDMIEALSTASSADFAHHVNPQKNDIANWISDIYNEPRLASKLRQTMDRAKIIQILKEQLAVSEEHLQKHIKKITTVREDGSLHENVQKLGTHIQHLEDELHHMTKRKTETAVKEKTGPIEVALLHETFRKGIAEFGFGMVIGIFIGLLIAKVMGLY